MEKELEFAKIRLVFENCDHLDIGKENINSVCFDGIKEYGINVNTTNKVRFHKKCDSVSVELKKDVEYFPFKKNPAKLLSDRTDIVWVILSDENNNELFSVYVAWNPADDCNNSWQENDVRADGRILLSIMTETDREELSKIKR